MVGALLESVVDLHDLTVDAVFPEVGEPFAQVGAEDRGSGLHEREASQFVPDDTHQFPDRVEVEGAVEPDGQSRTLCDRSSSERSNIDRYSSRERELIRISPISAVEAESPLGVTGPSPPQ